ncbi:MAG: terminase small subunit [Nitrospira sp.]
MNIMSNDATLTARTQKEEAFCVAVFAGQNPSDAYRSVYKPSRAKAKTVHEMASRLMAKRKVYARLAELMQPVIERAQMCREEWLHALARICRADVRQMFDSHGNPKEITELGDNEAASIAAFEFCEDFSGKGNDRRACGYTRRFRLTDKLKAFELYGKAMGYYTERQELTGKDGTPLSLTVEFVDPE